MPINIKKNKKTLKNKNKNKKINSDKLTSKIIVNVNSNNKKKLIKSQSNQPIKNLHEEKEKKQQQIPTQPPIYINFTNPHHELREPNSVRINGTDIKVNDLV